MIIFGSLIVNWVKKKKFGFFFINKIPSYERERERERDAYSCGDHKKSGEQKEHSFESHFRKRIRNKLLDN